MLGYQAFIDCSTDRQTAFGTGPIPFLSLATWCAVHGIDGDDRAYLIDLVMRVDREYTSVVNARAASK